MKTNPSLLITSTLLATAAAFSLATSATAAVPDGPPVFTDPLAIDNPYNPFFPGALKIFTGVDEGEKAVVVDQFLTETRNFTVNGVPVDCAILREIAFVGGELVEIADNYFAQADDGTVYYFGEVVDNYENGVIADHHGSWLVGGATLPTDPADTAATGTPAVFMPANPEVGDVFKPEDIFPLVDESDEVLSTTKRLSFRGQKFTDVLLIRETTQLSNAKEKKWYAPGYGVVMAKTTGELIRLSAASPEFTHGVTAAEQQ